jgi:hypothetical protein
MAGKGPKGFEYRAQQIPHRATLRPLKAIRGEGFMAGHRWTRRLKELRERMEELKGEKIEKE